MAIYRSLTTQRCTTLFQGPCAGLMDRLHRRTIDPYLGYSYRHLINNSYRQALRIRHSRRRRPPRLSCCFSRSWEVFNNHPLAGDRRDAGKRRAILAMQIARAQICNPYKFIPARKLENLVGFE
jgi:hypothetical protein